VVAQEEDCPGGFKLEEVLAHVARFDAVAARQILGLGFVQARRIADLDAEDHALAGQVGQFRGVLLMALLDQEIRRRPAGVVAQHLLDHARRGALPVRARPVPDGQHLVQVGPDHGHPQIALHLPAHIVRGQEVRQVGLPCVARASWRKVDRRQLGDHVGRIVRAYLAAAQVDGAIGDVQEPGISVPLAGVSVKALEALQEVQAALNARKAARLGDERGQALDGLAVARLGEQSGVVTPQVSRCGARRLAVGHRRPALACPLQPGSSVGGPAVASTPRDRQGLGVGQVAHRGRQGGHLAGSRVRIRLRRPLRGLRGQSVQVLHGVPVLQKIVHVGPVGQPRQGQQPDRRGHSEERSRRLQGVTAPWIVIVRQDYDAPAAQCFAVSIAPLARPPGRAGRYQAVARQAVGALFALHQIHWAGRIGGQHLRQAVQHAARVAHPPHPAPGPVRPALPERLGRVAHHLV